MKKIILSLMIALFSTTIYATPARVINFATEATYPPFEYVDEGGNIKGFDIDLANALCQQIKAQCTFTSQSFNSLITSLKLGKFDAIISALGITPERQEQVSFTNSYYQPSGSFIAQTSDHYTLASLPGKTIGVQTGTTFEKYLQDKYSGKITVKNYGSIQDAFLDLDSGRVDAVLADTPIAQTWLQQGDKATRFSIVDKPINDDAYFGSGFGIAVRKDDATLLTALNQALAVIKANGVYANLMQKYFGSKHG